MSIYKKNINKNQDSKNLVLDIYIIIILLLVKDTV